MQQQNAKHKQHNLERLRDLKNMEIAADDPDVRGWTVKTSDHRTLGVVDSLIADTATKEVRYLDVDLDDSIADNENPLKNKRPGAAGSTHLAVGQDNEQHVIVPIGAARIDKEEDIITIDSIDVEKLRSAPRIAKEGQISPAHELDLRRHFFDAETDTQLFKRWENARNTTKDWGSSFYDDKYSASRFYQHRRGS